MIFYKDETYDKLLTFIKSNCKDIIDVPSGKVTKHHASYGDYELEAKMEQQIHLLYKMWMNHTTSMNL